MFFFDLRNEIRQGGCSDIFPFFPPCLLLEAFQKDYSIMKRDFGGLRAVTWEILKYTWNFDKEKRARIEELRKKYPQTEFIIFKSQKDADFF